MPAGFTQLCKLIHYNYPADDVNGGAVPSGTVVYENLTIRIASEKPTMALLEQGVDSEEIFSAQIFAGNISVDQNDHIQVTAPAYGWFYNKKFRVIGIQRSSNNYFNDRNQIRLTLRRLGENHGNNYQ